MDDHKIKAIIFDLGNVLIDFNHYLASQKIAKFTEKTPEEIFNLFFDSPLTGLFEEGKLSPQDFFLKIKEMLNLKLDYPEFVPIWNEIFFLSEKNSEVYNLASALKQRYKIAIVSNINILHFVYLKQHFSMLESFPHIITSYEVGVRKPNPLIYERTLEVLGVKAQEAFYTDDRPELTDSAKELGIHGFLFKGIEQLKKDLRQLKVLDKNNIL